MSKTDIYAKENPFRLLSLSDENVVKYLILYRGQVDLFNSISTNFDANLAGDVFELNQELIALYASLDSLIEKANMNDDERKFLGLLLEGYTVPEIIQEKHFKKTKCYRMRDRIIAKICEKNYDVWSEWVENYINDGAQEEWNEK